MQNRPKPAMQIDRSSELFTTIIQAIQDKKGAYIVSLDLRDIEESVSDFFIICEAETDIETRAIANSIEMAVRQECDEKPFQLEISEEWILIDYVNIVVHIFKPEDRKFYDLEGLWLDSEKVTHDLN